MQPKVERVWVEVVHDDDPDTSYLEQDEWEDRREAYERGDFSFVGVRVCAEIHFATDQGGWIVGPTVKTPGLWGIETDSDESYLREVAGDEAHTLEEMLRALGISRGMASYARRLVSASELQSA